MAVLTDSQYAELRSLIYRSGTGKEELKALPSLPNGTQIRAAFQALEDFWEANRSTLKSQIDSALGFTTTAALARKIGLAWLQVKVRAGG